MTDVLIRIGCTIIYIGCLVAEHYGLIPVGSELIAVGIWAGEALSTLRQQTSTPPASVANNSTAPATSGNTLSERG